MRNGIMSLLTTELVSAEALGCVLGTGLRREALTSCSTFGELSEPCDAVFEVTEGARYAKSKEKTRVIFV